MSKKFVIRKIDEDKELDYHSEQGWVVKQVITHEVVHNGVNGLKWDRYHILFERDNEDGDTEKLKALEIIKSHAKEIKHFKYLLYMAKYWEENKVEVTKELLYNYDFPYTIDEFNLLKEVMK